MQALRHYLRVTIFGTDTVAGRIFDIALLVAILASVLAMALETVPELDARYDAWFDGIEWAFTFCLRWNTWRGFLARSKPLRYMVSFFGIVDLISILPTWFALVWPSSEHFGVIRSLRLLRVFRVLKLTRYLGEAHILRAAKRAGLPKITVFMLVVIMIVVLLGTAMYLIEGPQNGFTSIPLSIYWAIVTITTVGYGDISPHTPLGQFLAAIAMITGYGIIAVPTGIVGAELVQAVQSAQPKRLWTVCSGCGLSDHQAGANFCRACGTELDHDGEADGSAR